MSLRLILQQFRIQTCWRSMVAVVAAISLRLTAAIARRIGSEQFTMPQRWPLSHWAYSLISASNRSSGKLRAPNCPIVPPTAGHLSGHFNVAVLFVAGGALMFNAHVLLVVSIALCFSGVAFTQLISAGCAARSISSGCPAQAASRVISAVAILAVLLFWPDVTIIIGPGALERLPGRYMHSAPLTA